MFGRLTAVCRHALYDAPWSGTVFVLTLIGTGVERLPIGDADGCRCILARDVKTPKYIIAPAQSLRLNLKLTHCIFDL